MIDSTITLPIIISVCAFASAPITAAINNYHQRKMRKMEIESTERQHKFDVLFENKLDAYRTFVKTAGIHHDLPDSSSQREILSSANSAVLLCDPDSSKLLSNFLLNIPDCSEYFDDDLLKICDSFNQDLINLSEIKKK